MKIERKSLARYLVLILLFLLAAVSERIYFGETEYRILTRRAEKTVARKSEKMLAALETLRETGFTDESIRLLSGRIDFEALDRQGITLLVFSDDSLVFWSNNSMEIPEGLPGKTARGGVLFIHNGYFLAHSVESAGKVYVGLLRLYCRYDIVNSHIRRGFPEFYGLPAA
ncbi:MAG: hypothetical protein FJY11_01700, partial [Bacteroidetes bacterium]|nr:hypothetical protein [Bacteroidota bacterium]